MDSIGEFKKPDQGNVPEGVKGWSWGAFLLSWVWAIGNRTWTGLLCLLPFIGFIFAIILGIKGREWAWKNKKWQDLDHFNRVQRKWSVWGVGLFIAILAIGLITVISIPAYKDYSIRNQAPITELNDIRLGMTPVEVTLKKGRPDHGFGEFNSNPENSTVTAYWTYSGSQDYPYKRREEIAFTGASESELKVDQICSEPQSLYYQIKGFDTGMSSSMLVKKFGKPSSSSINSDGTSLLLNYKKFNVSFEFETDTLTKVCISTDGELFYANAYQGSLPADGVTANAATSAQDAAVEAAAATDAAMAAQDAAAEAAAAATAAADAAMAAAGIEAPAGVEATYSSVTPTEETLTEASSDSSSSP